MTNSDFGKIIERKKNPKIEDDDTDIEPAEFIIRHYSAELDLTNKTFNIHDNQSGKTRKFKTVQAFTKFYEENQEDPQFSPIAKLMLSKK